MTSPYTHYGDAAGTPINWRDKEDLSVENIYGLVKKGRFILDPPHQRNVVHCLSWKQGIISTLMGEAPADIPALRWHPVKGRNGKKIWISLDGKQRLTAITEFKENKFTWHGKFYNKGEDEHTITDEERNCIDDFKIVNKTTNRTLTPEEILNSFNKFQQTKQTKLGEKLNGAGTTGSLSKAMDKIMDNHRVPIRKLFSLGIRQRFAPLEIYAKCFYYFRNGAEAKGENVAIQKMWVSQLQPDYVHPSANALSKFAKLMRMTLLALIDPRNAKVSHKRTKILQIFLLMNWSYPQTDNRDEHYEFICENFARLVASEDYSNVLGNHRGHVVHFEFLKRKVQAAEFKDASSGEEDA